jgi:hypothetical protein
LKGIDRKMNDISWLSPWAAVTWGALGTLLLK